MINEARRKKYFPNLPDLMRLCATNYVLMLRILSNKEKVGFTFNFLLSEQLSYAISVIEVTKYTSLISIAQQNNINVKTNELSTAVTDVLSPSMSVRLYHDAKLAEVISSQNIRQIKPRYDYPNKDMHLPDEKQQINLFLKEWLQVCIKLGQVSLPRFNT